MRVINAGACPNPLDFRDILFPKVTPGHGYQAAFGFRPQTAIAADFQNLLRKTAPSGDGCGCTGKVGRVSAAAGGMPIPCSSSESVAAIAWSSLRRSRQRCGVGHVGRIRHCQWITLIDLGVELRLSLLPASVGWRQCVVPASIARRWH